MSDTPDPEKIQTSIEWAAAKPAMHKLPGYALEEVACILAFGDEKHGETRRLGISHSYWVGKALRHIFTWNEGEDNDPETGRSHISHAATDILCLLQEIHDHPEKDDRYNPGEVTYAI